jgi:S1-C subfamily serine protease
MSSTGIYDAVKNATVALIATYENALPKRPFTIIGSGFCIFPDGVIVTCDHVFKGFCYSGKKNAAPGDPFRLMAPHAMFFGGVEGKEILMHSVGIHQAVTIKGFDLCAMKLDKCDAYPDGYPALPIADYGELHEMMEIATCGYPLGEVLQDQLGTVTSSFTKGMISSIIPAQGVSLQHLQGFQLDLTATNGNSGGPVFSLQTGNVFGVLQRGVVHPATGHVVQGLAKAEPIFPLFADDVLDRLRSKPAPTGPPPMFKQR